MQLPLAPLNSGELRSLPMSTITAWGHCRSTIAGQSENRPISERRCQPIGWESSPWITGKKKSG